jgi:hypothetical protein
VAPSIDVTAVDVGATILIRGELLSRERPCDEYCVARVKVMAVVGSDHRYHLSGEIRVAFRSSGPGIAPGVSTIHLAPYNQYLPSGLWRLAEESSGKPLTPTDAQVARAWVQATLGGDPAWLPELTALPFSFHSTYANHCQQKIDSVAELLTWSACIQKWGDPFVEGLLFGGERKAEPLEKVPPRLAKVVKGVEPGVWVSVAGEYAGFHATLLLRIRGDGARKVVSSAVADVVLDAQGIAELKRRKNHELMADAIARGDKREVQQLLDRGAGVDSVGRDDFPGDSPVTTAAAKGDLAIVDVLLRAGANPNACCCSCITALHRAIEAGHLAVVARLLESGANPRIKYDARLSTLELAERTGNPEIVRLVEDALNRPPRAR